MLKHISSVNSILAADRLAHESTKFGQFLKFAEPLIPTPLARGQCVATVVNEGIDHLPQPLQASLLGWAKKEMLAPQQFVVNRRRFLIDGGSALLTGSMAAGSAATDHPVTAAVLAATTATVLGSSARGEYLAAECEKVFREKLPVWLKEKHDIDFAWPAQKAKAAK